MTNNSVAGQIGVNPDPYNWNRFKAFDPKGNLINTPEIEAISQQIEAIYYTLPSYSSYSKEMIDAWVAENSESDSSMMYAANDAEFLNVIVVQNGFFKDHKIIVNSVEFDANNQLKIEYSATDAEGKVMDKLEALQTIVQGIITLSVYEQMLETVVEEEKVKRFG